MGTASVEEKPTQEKRDPTHDCELLWKWLEALVYVFAIEVDVVGKIVVADTLKLRLVASYIPVASVLDFLYFWLKLLDFFCFAIDVIAQLINCHFDQFLAQGRFYNAIQFLNFHKVDGYLDFL